MYSVFHVKVFIWFTIICGLCWFVYHRRTRIKLKFQETFLKLKRRLGGQIALNDSFADDLESGLNSTNFDIISGNTEDTRAGLDDLSKQQIREIMETENISFDKARLMFTKRKFDQNLIAQDGTPMDPKAVTFSK
ncbi:hypothetical protein MOSE0_G03576 [Monosporozyma servazzii]